MNKKIFIIFLFGIFSVFLLANFSFAQPLELEYPEVPGVVTPRTAKTLLPDYVKYLFNLGAVLAGLAAFISLLYGGFRYITSAGNPNALSDARSQIFSGILGLILILGSYLLLTTINPQLVILKTGDIGVQKGIILYTSAHCPGGSNPIGEEGQDYAYYRVSNSTLRDIRGEGYNREVKSVYFFSGNEDLEVFLYEGEDYQGNYQKFNYQNVNQCLEVTEVRPKSVFLYWKISGVYLCNEPLKRVGSKLICEGEERIYIGDTAELGDFDNQVHGLRLVDKTECVLNENCQKKCQYEGLRASCIDNCKANCQTPGDCVKTTCQRTVFRYGAVLHEKSNFQHDAQVFLNNVEDLSKAGCSTTWPGPYCVPQAIPGWVGENNQIDRPGEGASAITIFPLPLSYEKPWGDGVTLYADYDYNNEKDGEQINDCANKNCKCGPLAPTQPLWVGTTWIGDDNKAVGEPSDSDCKHVLQDNQKTSSIRIHGSYLVVLFREDGRGEVFRKSDVRLAGNHIDNDKTRFMLIIPCSPTGGCSPL